MKAVYILIPLVLVGCGSQVEDLKSLAPKAPVSDSKTPKSPSGTTATVTPTSEPDETIAHPTAEFRCLKEDQWFQQNDYGCYSAQAQVTVGKERIATIHTYLDAQIFLQTCGQSTESGTIFNEWRLPTGEEFIDFTTTNSVHLNNQSTLYRFKQLQPSQPDLSGRMMPSVIIFDSSSSANNIALTNDMSVDVSFAYNCVK